MLIIEHTGVEQGAIDATIDQSKRFFDLPADVKATYGGAPPLDQEDGGRLNRNVRAAGGVPYPGRRWVRTACARPSVPRADPDAGGAARIAVCAAGLPERGRRGADRQRVDPVPRGRVPPADRRPLLRLPRGPARLQPPHRPERRRAAGGTFAAPDAGGLPPLDAVPRAEGLPLLRALPRPAGGFLRLQSQPRAELGRDDCPLPCAAGAAAGGGGAHQQPLGQDHVQPCHVQRRDGAAQRRRAADPTQRARRHAGREQRRGRAVVRRAARAGAVHE